MKTQLKITFSPTDIRSLLLAQATENNALPANIEADSLQMRISPVTGVTFIPAEEAATTETDADENTPEA